MELTKQTIDRIQSVLGDFTPQIVSADSPKTLETLCGACGLQRGEQPDTPILFSLLSVDALSDYIEQEGLEKVRQSILNTRHPVRGYTYLHQVCWTYFHEKPRYKNPELSKSCYDLLRFLNFSFPFEFGVLVNTGFDKAGREANTPLHESLRDIGRIGKADQSIIHRFQMAGCDFSREDSHGYSIQELIRQAGISHGAQQTVRILTGQFKRLENGIVQRMQAALPVHFIHCEGCGKEMYRNDRIISYPQSKLYEILTEEDIVSLCQIVEMREEIVRLRSNGTLVASKQRHEYIIDVWRTVLFRFLASVAAHNSDGTHETHLN